MNMALDFFEMMKKYLDVLLQEMLNSLEEWLLFPTEQIPIIMLLVFLVLCFAVFVIVSQYHTRLRPMLLGVAFGAVPLAVFVILISLESMRGGPDDRCDKYSGGDLALNIIGVHKTRRDKHDLFSGEWILLLVRSARWGNDPHLCRVGTETKAGEMLLNTFFPKNKKGEREQRTESFGEGEITFRFGRPREEPNVTFKPTAQPDKKRAPAEPSREQTF